MKQYRPPPCLSMLSNNSIFPPTHVLIQCYHHRLHLFCHQISSQVPRADGAYELGHCCRDQSTINEAQHPHRKPNKERKARRYGSRSGPKGSKLFFEKMQQLLRTRTKAIPNTIVLYRPNFWSYISIWFGLIDSHTNFYMKRCLATRISCRSRKLVPQFSITARQAL